VPHAVTMKLAIIAIIALPMVEAAVISRSGKATVNSGHVDEKVLKTAHEAKTESKHAKQNEKFQAALQAVSAMAAKQKRTEEEKREMAAEYLQDDEEEEEEERQLQAKEQRTTAGRRRRTLYQSDFSAGTKKLDSSGWYQLMEDISFNPSPTYPDLDSTDYPQGDGYFLGFFAAIAMEGDNVRLNCRGYTIKMSDAFHKRQRFFSVIELASRPFIPNAGPPPLSNPAMNPDAEIRSATGVRIRNCRFGLTSHHSIHGNGNDGVAILDSYFRDFEVGAIALNNAYNVAIRRNDIGPSLTTAWPAALSQAIFLNHMATEVGLADSHLQPVFAETNVVIRGESHSAQDWMTYLNSNLTAFLGDETAGTLASVLGPQAIPDGSALYGVLLHKSGPAVGEFGACPMHEYLNGSEPLIENSKLRWLDIHNLELNPEAWISFHQDQDDGSSRQVQGPAGAVFRATKWTSSPSTSTGTNLDGYVGNALSDAQIALAQVYDAAVEGSDETAQQRAEDYFVAAYVPQEIRDWAASGSSTLDTSAFNLKCDGDAMSHLNKGIVGIRLGYQSYPVVGPAPPSHREHRRRGVVMRNFTNHGVGPEDADLCTPGDYLGNDVRGIRLTNCNDVRGVDAEDLAPGAGGHLINSQYHTTSSYDSSDLADDE